MDNGEIVAHARFADAPAGHQTQGTALLGLKADLGMVALGAEGGLNMRQTGTATSSTGFGGSAFAYARDLLPVPMFETPVVRVDFAGQDFAGTAGNSNPHYRLIGGLSHTWAPGAESMLSYEIEQDMTSGQQVTQTIGWKGGLKF